MRSSTMRSAANRLSAMRSAAMRNDRFEGGTTYGYEALASAANRSIKLNGEEQAPQFVYLGKNASAAGWTATVGDGLAFTENGADATYGVDIGTKNALDKGVTYAAGDYHRSTGTTEGDVDLEDLIFEIGCTIGATEKTLIAKNTNAFLGWQFSAGGTGRVYFYMRNGAAIVSVEKTGMVVGSRHLVHLVVDRSGNARISVDGSQGSPVNASALAALSLSNAYSLSIGGRYGSPEYSNSGFHYAAMWKFSDIGTDDQAAWVASRWALFGGFA